MVRKNYMSPSVRYIKIQMESLLASSSNYIKVDHEEGVWEADANAESAFGSIWYTEENTLWE